MRKRTKWVYIGIGLLLAGSLSTGLLWAVNPTRLKSAPMVAFGNANKVKTALDLTSPEAALQSYFKCLQLGDRDGVSQCYDRKGLTIAKPVPIKSFQIVKKIVSEGAQTTSWAGKSSPVVQPGDVELQVKLVYQGGPIPIQDEQQGSYSYLLRKTTDSKWTIIAHLVLG